MNDKYVMMYAVAPQKPSIISSNNSTTQKSKMNKNKKKILTNNLNKEIIQYVHVYILPLPQNLISFIERFFNSLTTILTTNYKGKYLRLLGFMAIKP